MWDRKIILQRGSLISFFFKRLRLLCLCCIYRIYTLQKQTMDAFPFVSLLLLHSTHHSDFLEFIIKTRLNSSSLSYWLSICWIRHCMCVYPSLEIYYVNSHLELLNDDDMQKLLFLQLSVSLWFHAVNVCGKNVVLTILFNSSLHDLTGTTRS